MDYISAEKRVLDLAKNNGFTKKSLSEALSMSRVGYDYMWKNGTIKVTNLITIATLLNTTINYILYGEGVQNANPIIEKKAKETLPENKTILFEERLGKLEARMCEVEKKVK